MPGGPIEGRHLVLLTTEPAGLHVAVCGRCSAVVSREQDGEMRHLLSHQAAGEFDGPDRPLPAA